MGDKTRRTLSIELDDAEGDGDAAISGRLDDGAHAVSFRGWLALAAALERIRRGGSARPASAVNTDQKGGSR
jgi:hypothetical protein